jgi:hypothetical protein
MSDRNQRRSRRAFLGAAAATAVAGLAGCQGQSTDEDTGDDKAGGQPTKTLTADGSSGAGVTELAFGETLSLPRVDVTLSNPRTMSSYEWHKKGESEQRVARAGDDNQWLKVDLTSSNTVDRVVRLPLTMNFKGVVGEVVYHPGRNKSPQEKYIGGKVPAGGNREGSMAFLLPEGVSVEEFRVRYTEQRPSGKREAWWM